MATRAVVIGAGVFGTWIALWLRRRGAEVVLLDQYGAGNSLASSGDESRVTRSAHGSDEHYPVWQRRALEQWLQLERDAGSPLFVRTGVAWFAHRDDGFEAESAETLARLGIPLERLERDDVSRRWPHIETHDIDWALFEPEGGALLARRAVGVAADRVMHEGGSVSIGQVRAPSPGDGSGEDLSGVRLVDGRRLHADLIIYACGAWLAKLFGHDLLLELAITRQEVVYVATPPGDSRFDAGASPIWIDYDRAFYGIPSIERRGFKVAPDWPGPIVDPDRQERRLTEELVEEARRYLRVRFPALAGQPVAEGRVCQYEATPDTHFVIDRHPAWRNVWIVGGGSGHGFKHGPVIGEYVSAVALGDASAAAGLAPPDDRFALRARASGRIGRTAGVPAKAAPD